MSSLADQLAASIQGLVAAAIARGDIAGSAPDSIVLERPKNRDHGDYATSIALQLAKAAGSDSGIFKGKLYRPKAVTVDRDFFSSGRGEQALSSAIEAKFRQSTELRNVLLGTLNARIYHFQRGERPVLFKPLLQVRAKLEIK